MEANNSWYRFWYDLKIVLFNMIYVWLNIHLMYDSG